VSLKAQQSNAINNQILKGQFWGVAEGLSHRQVNSIIQDNNDLIWLATDYGINSFDGKDFKWFTSENSGLQEDAVAILKKDANGFIWIFYSDLNKTSLRNVDILDPQKEEIISLQEFLTDTVPFDFSEVITMSLTESEDIIFATHKSLFYYSDRFSEISLKGSDVANLRGIERSPDGSFWLSYYMLYSDTSYFKVLSPEGKFLDSIGFEESHYIDIYEWDTLGRPHFYVYYDKLERAKIWQSYYIYDREAKFVKDYQAEKRFKNLNLKNNFSRRFFLKVGDLYWVYSKDERILVVPEDPKEEVINLRDVSKELRNGGGIYTDRLGAVWINTAYGIHRFTLDDLRFKRYFYEINRLDTRSIRGIKISGKGKDKKLWAMSEMPRLLYSQTLNSNKARIEGSFSGGKWALSFGSDSTLLYMTDAGLKVHSLVNPKLNNLIPLPPNVSGGAWVIHQDKYRQYWFNSHFRASFFRLSSKGNDLQEFSRWHDTEVNPYVYQIYENESDTAWIVTAAGIFSLDLKSGEVFERYWSGGKGKYFLENDNIQHLLANDDGSYWLATAKSGLQKWSPEEGRITHYGRLEGLPSNNIYAVYRDQKDNLWLSTEFGIAHIDLSSDKIRSYTKIDGLANNEFNRISHYKDDEGIIYFGGLNGVTSFQPLDFYKEEDSYEPNLVFNALEVFMAQKDSVYDLRVEALEGSLEIKPGDYITKISVALLSFEEQEKVQYAYKLEGLDEDWTYQASDVIQLGKLPYGDYVLKIRGQEASGRWSQRQLRLAISVSKPFYLTTWFILSGIFLVISGGAIYFNLRQRAQKARQIELEKLVLERTETIENQKMELLSLDRMKSRFFANISHELRTPLTLISTPLKKLLKEGKGFDETEKRWLSYMQRNADILLGLVNEILDLAKLEEGKLELNLEKVALFQHFEVLMEPFKTIAKEKNITFNWQINFDPKLIVEIDKVKVDKVITNLLSNAFKFSDEGGSVNVNIRPDDQDQLIISITDKGLGIKHEELDKVFERFYQTKPTEDSEVVEAHGGTGLGLALSKDLAQLMQGKLWVESEWQKGSTFYFKFPYSLAAGQAEMPTDENIHAVEIGNQLGQNLTKEERAKPHILLVEDNPDLLGLLKDLLQGHYRITLAENGAVAWRILKSHQEKKASSADCFDLVLSDQMMPVMDGLSLLNKIKQDPVLSLLPFIMLTARTEAKLRLSALRIGVNDFLTKPFEEEELRLRIENLLLNQKVRQSVIAEETSLDNEGEAGSIEKEDARAKHKGHTKEEEIWLERFDTFINENLNNSALKVSEIAFQFAMSDSTLLRQVKKLTGLSPQKYLQEARMQKALIHIEDGEFSSLSSLSKAVGFGELASFSRSFKTRFGKSPSSFID
tara:strand:- start:13743 stop:17861 length:4119 start_codon:yes stop_codon:yes gene_type:complete